MTSTSLSTRFARHLRTSHLIESGATVLVACSGGLDSVVLLHLLRFGGALHDLRLVVAHFDHGMRADSAADADWVTALCQAWDAPLVVARAHPPPDSETSARRARYRFLQQAATESGSDCIATAHQADDQAETVLFRLARGTGLAGLAGIPARRGRIVRPLLPFSRQELARYAHALRLDWREDPTNQSLAFARNRIRHTLLPALESVRPGAARALAALAAEAQEAEAAWAALLDEAEKAVVQPSQGDAIVLARPALQTYHPHLRARLLRRLLRRFDCIPGRSGTRAALEFISSGASGGAIELAGGIRLERDFDRLILRAAAPLRRPPDQPLVIRQPGSGRGRAIIGGRTYLVEWTQQPSGGPPGESFDPAALSFPLELRGWRPGDRLQLAYGTKKLKKLFGERRLSRAERHRVPVLAQADGRVVWVPHIARAACAPPAAHEPAFSIRIEDDEHD